MKKTFFLNRIMMLLFVLGAHVTYAQHTGSYDTSITFMGAARTVSIYAPSSYTPSTAYRLIIGLHGLGDNSPNYRNALVAGLGWGARIPNTIIVCPEAFNVNADYYYPAGDDSVIQASINLAMSLYHIDTTNVVLQGFSLGGRAALRYGLDNYTRFKGLLLNTPAIQGVKDAINGTGYSYTYANAAHIPIYITHGLDDIIYEAPIDSAYEQLIRNNGIVRHFEIAGLGHAIPPFDSMLNFIPFFDTPFVHGYDLDVVKPVIAQRSCVTAVPATCLVRNTGANTIHSITLQYTVAGTPLSYTWSGAIASFQHAVIALPTITAPVGNQSLAVSVTALDTGALDTITYNNSKTVPFQVVTTGTPLPLFEGFEGVFPPTNWIQYLAGDAYTPWAADSTVSKSGIASMGTFNTILIFDNSGRREEMASPLLDLTSVPDPYLTFDVAYNYHHYQPPTATIDSSFADTLEVLISTDCGDTYTSLYKKGGTQLATFSNPILNPTSVGADFIVPADSNWRTDRIDLSAYAASNKAIVKFSYISALGGSINIDNINFRSNPVTVPPVTASRSNVYPNPADGYVNIATGTDHLSSVSIIDAMGRTVSEMTNSTNGNEMQINTSALTEGVYILRILSENKVQNTTLLIKH